MDTSDLTKQIKDAVGSVQDIADRQPENQQPTIKNPDKLLGLGKQRPQEQAAPPVYNPEKASSVKYYNAMLDQRLGKINWWKEDPMTAAWLSGSSLPEHHIEAIARHLPDVNQWVEQGTSLGGVPGFLKGAYTKAINIQDPNMRVQAVATLDSLRSLSPDQQQAFLAFAKGNAATPGALAAIQQATVSGGEGAVENGAISLGADANAQYVSSLETLFPELKGKLHFTEGGITKDDIVAGLGTSPVFSAEATAINQQPLNKPLNWGQIAYGLGMQEVTDVALAGGMISGPVGASLVGGSLLAGQVSSPGGLGPQKGPAATILRGGFAPFRMLNNAMGAAAHGLGQVVKVVDPNASDQTIDAAGNVILAIALYGATRGASSIAQEAHIVTPEAAEGVAGGRPPLPSMGEAIANQLKQPLVQTLLHPIASTLGPAIDVAARELAESTGIADWTAKKSFSRLYDSAEALRSQNSTLDTKVAQLRNTFPNLSTDAARRVLSVDREHMPLEMADFIRNPHGAGAENTGAILKRANSLMSRTWKNFSTAYKKWEGGANAETVAAINAEIDRRVPQAYTGATETGMDVQAAQLEEPGNTIQQQVDFWKQNGTLTPVADAEKAGVPGSMFEHTDAQGVRSVYYVNDEGKVLGYRTIADSAESITAPSEQGQGIGSALEMQYLKEQGIDTPEKMLDYLKSKGQGAAFTPAGAALNKSVVRRMFGAPTEEEIAQLEQDYNEAVALQQEADIAANAALKPVEPQWQLPTSSKLPEYLHRAMLEPRTVTEHVVGRIINFSPTRAAHSFTNRLLHTDFSTNQSGMLTRLTDKMASDIKDNRLLNPLMAKSDPEKAFINDRNLTYMNRLMGRLGVSRAEIDQVTGQMLAAKSQQEWFDIVNNKVFGHNGVIAAHLPKNLTSEVRDRILSTSSRDPLNFTGGVPRNVDGRTVLEPPVMGEIRNGTPVPLPFLDNEFITGVILPAEEDIMMATSGLKRLAKTNKAAGLAYGSLKFTLDATRLILKPLALTFSLPAVIFHKLADETLGNVLSPDIMNPVAAPGTWQTVWANLRHPSKWGEGLPWGEQPLKVQESMRDATSRTLAGAVEPGAETAAVPVSATKILSQNDVKPEVFSSLRDSIDHFRQSRIAQMIARNNLDVAEAEAAMTGGDIQLTQFYEDNIRPQLERAGIDLHTALTRQAEAIKYATFGGNPDYLKYIATGKLDTHAGMHVPEGASWRTDFEGAQRRVQSIRSELTRAGNEQEAASLRRTPDGQAHILALQTELREELARMDTIARKYRVTLGSSKRYIGSDRQDAIAARIKQQFLNNEITLPDVITMKKVVSDGYFQLGMMDNVRLGLGRLSEAGYRPLRLIGKAEGLFARGGFYNQRFISIKAELIRQGMTDENAAAFAAIKATHETTDLFYDLTARSTLEKTTRNIFWFAPVTGELLYRWSYGIPSQVGAWLPGMAITAARVTNYVQLFKNLGFLKYQYNPSTGKNELGVTIPGMAGFINMLTGSHLTENPMLPLTGVFSHISSPIPTLAPIPAALLDRAIAPHIPAIQGLSNLLAPYDNLTVVPTTVRNLAGVFGIPLPDMSPDYVDSSWNRTHDVALQYAWTYMHKNGDDQPDPMKFGLKSGPDGFQGTLADQKAYTDAWTQWYGRLQSEANSMSKGLYLMKAFDSFAVPGSLSYSIKEQRDFSEFFQTHVLPNLVPGQPMPLEIQTQLQDWESQHPGSLAFTVSMGQYTGKPVPDKDIIDSSEGWRTLYLEGVKKYMNPTDYANTLAGLTSKAMYVGRLNAGLADVAGKGPVPKQVVNVLTHWGDRSQEMHDYTNNWNNYLLLHPEIKDTLELNSDKVAKAYGTRDVQGLESQYVNQALSALDQLRGLFIGNGAGVSTDEFKTVLANLKAARADLYQNTNGQLTPMEKGLNYYFDNVLTPYMKATEPLYQQGQDISAAGGDASGIYAQIDQMKKQYTGLQWQGQTLPNPDEFFFGNKNPVEQRLAKIHWASQPISWLSDFQRSQMGYPNFKGQDQFWSGITKISQEADDTITANNMAPGSNDYNGVKNWEQQQQEIYAESVGPKAVEALHLQLAAPAYRIQVMDRGFTKNDSWKNVMSMVTYATETLQKAGESPKGSSSDAIALKQWVYSYLQQQESVDSDFRDLMEQLSLSTTIQGRHPMGVPLYEAIFFNQFVPQYVDSQLMDSFVPQEGVF